MKKIIFGTIFSVFALAIIVAPALAKGPDGPAGKSNQAHLYLYEKDSSWNIVEGGAWGKMTYNQTGPTFDYVFNGHGLVPGDDYTLLYYPDPWPGTGLQCLGAGVANGGGNVTISEAVETSNLPIVSDNNHKWDISGNWSLDFAGGNANREFRNLVQDAEGYVVGEFWWLHSGVWEYGGTLVGTVIGDALHLDYDRCLIPYTGIFDGTIGASGITNGTFSDSDGNHLTWTATGDLADKGGAKIWLVESDDVDCDNYMVGWNPTKYLFENKLINFTSI